MRPTPLRRTHLAIAGILSLTLTSTFLAHGTAVSPGAATAEPEPQFLGWEGEPFDDDLNHYLVRIGPTATDDQDGWLQIDADDHLIATTPPPQPGVALGDIENLVSGETDQQLDTADILAMIKSRADVGSVRSVGFGIYAIAGSISGTTLAGIAGTHDVVADTGVDATTVDPYYPTQWALENDGVSLDPWVVSDDADIDAPEGWHRTRGNGVVVAVIDSGADINHPDLAENIWRNTFDTCGNGADDDGNGYVDDCTGWDFANNDSSVDDLVGHGTHIAGIVAAAADNGIGVAGVAYESEVMVLKIGDGTPAVSAGIEAIAYAINNGARIINASWVVDDPAAAPYLETALAAAEAAGVLVVTGAGNEPVNIDEYPVYPAASALGNVIVVGASTPTDEPASWSGFGENTVDLFAPGEFIISTVPGGYGVYSGTSMAAPMVTGAAALLWAATPEASYQEVKGALLDRSDGPNDGVTAFADLAASDGRLNIERAIYSRLFQPHLMYEFSDFNSFKPTVTHQVTITTKSVDPWIAPPQTPVMYRAGLYVPLNGEPMAVVGQEISYLAAGADVTVATDGTGRALVGAGFEPEERPVLVQDGDDTPLTMELPAGTYAFVMEVVDVTDASNPITLGDPSAVFFIVAEDGSIAEMPQIPIGGTPQPTTSSTADPVSSTTEAPLATSTTTAGPTSTTGPGFASTTILPATTTTLDVPTTTVPASTPTTTTLPTTTTVAPTTAPPPIGDATTTTTTTIPGPVSTTTTTTTTEAPVDPDALAITGINPPQGPVAGRTMVTITGRNLPELPDVFFGDRRANVVSVVAPTFIVVDTPPGAAGFVDVTVVDRVSGDEIAYADGFQYVEEGQEPIPTTTAAPTTTTTVIDTATTTTVATSTTAATPTTSPLTTSTIIVELPDLPSLDDWLDSVLRTPEGLTLAPPADDAAIGSIPVELWAGALCDQPVCPGWVLEQ